MKRWFLHSAGLYRSWDWVTTYKVQLSNDSMIWKPCMNGTEEAVRMLFFKPSANMKMDVWLSFKPENIKWKPNKKLEPKMNLVFFSLQALIRVIFSLCLLPTCAAVVL